VGREGLTRGFASACCRFIGSISKTCCALTSKPLQRSPASAPLSPHTHPLSIGVRTPIDRGLAYSTSASQEKSTLEVSKSASEQVALPIQAHART